MQSWVEVPAKIEDVKFPGAGGGSHRAAANYTYEFDGKQYQGQRVGLLEISDNFGDFQQRAFNELKRHHDDGTPFRAFVNPNNPSQSVLYRQLRWELMSFFSIFPAVFGSAGLGMAAGAYAASRRTTASAPTNVPKDQLWTARGDWASGKILDAGAATVAVPVLAVTALWWIIALAPFHLKLPGMLAASDSPFRWVTLAFPAIAVVLLLALTYQATRRRKYGESVLQLASTPGVIGGQLAGVVKIPRDLRAAGGVRMKLSCIERKAGRKNESYEEVLWQDEQIVTEPMRDSTTGTTAVPVLFAIPYEAQESMRPDSTRCVQWLLEVTANMPGVDYKARFDVPVFKTADSRPDFKLDKSLRTDYMAAPPRDLVLREAGIIKEPLPGCGVRLIFPARRNWKSALVVTAFLAFWSGAIGVMFAVGVPWYIPILFAVPGLFMLGIAAFLWLYRSTVEARADGLTFRGGLLGIGRKHSWAAADVKRFSTSETMTSGKNVWKDVVVHPKNGKKRAIANLISSKLAQEAVIDELNAALRRE
jgi:hypothetical protein